MPQLAPLHSVLEEARALLAAADNDFTWSSWQDRDDALAEIDALLADLRSGTLPSTLALLRIGATREGILRQYMSSPHKGARDIALFSIIDREWPAIKARLEQRLYWWNTPST